DDAPFVTLDPQRLRAGTVILDHNRLHVQADIRHVFNDAGNGRELVLHTLQLHPRDRAPLQTGEENPSQAIADCRATTSLEGFDHKPAVGARERIALRRHPAWKFQTAPTNSHSSLPPVLTESTHRSPGPGTSPQTRRFFGG